MTSMSLAQVDAPAHDSVTGLLKSEWTKIRSVRSTIWSLVLFVVVALGLTVLRTGVTVASWNSSSPEQRAPALMDPTGFILGFGIGLGQLAICVLGVMIISSEYSTGMIRASLLAVPRRLPMLWAKCIVFGLLVLIASAVTMFASFFLGSAIMQAKVPISLGDPQVARAVIGGALYLAVLGLFSLAIGSIVRSTAAGIAVTIGLVLVITPLLHLIPGTAGKYIHSYMPSEAGQLVAQVNPGNNEVLTAWTGFAVCCGWTVLLLVIAAVMLKRRDA